MTDNLAESIGRLGIFADLTRSERQALADELAEESFAEGRWILRQGGGRAGLYIIVEGEVGVIVDDEERATLATGSFFGEVSVLLGEPPTAGIVTRSALRCLVIQPDEVEEFLLAHPRVMYRMLQTEVRRLRTADPERN
ncbi:cyclic nucleotide-binding domain-containing protein [Nonomuraea insulae]|uniref:Cyclic nucleotide-binding domain-containing protein n=1 Tax=Nonomuraea insulae TaxID=1616787 RepID=A0ABW1CQ38_9ACTN